jgi:hypothetical protein
MPLGVPIWFSHVNATCSSEQRLFTCLSTAYTGTGAEPDYYIYWIWMHHPHLLPTTCTSYKVIQSLKVVMAAKVDHGLGRKKKVAEWLIEELLDHHLEGPYGIKGRLHRDTNMRCDTEKVSIVLGHVHL